MSNVAPETFDTRTVAGYAAQIASASPTPGGGSVAATVGAFACALAEMVCNVTLSGKSAVTHPKELQKAAEAGSKLRAKLLSLAAADEAAYAGYQTALALPRGNEDEVQARRAALERALAGSTAVPLEIARTSLEVLDLLLIAAEHGTKYALSDVSTGAVLAKASIRSALFTARVNVVMTRDETVRARNQSEIDSLHERTTSTANSVLTAVEQRTIAG